MSIKKNNTKYTKYKFRAECYVDLLIFLNKTKNTTKLRAYTSFFLDKKSDFEASNEVEIISSLSLKQLMEIAGKIPDGHVIFETINPSEKYKGQRIFSRSAKRMKDEK